MKLCGAWILLVALGCSLRVARAQLEVLPTQLDQPVFGGGTRTIPVICHNAGERAVTERVRWRLYQTSSASTAPVTDQPWQRLDLLPRQTVLVGVPVDFPAVRARTRFLVQWVAETNRVAGQNAILAYPTNLLHELTLLPGVGSPGLLDPNGWLDGSLRQNGVQFVDLENLVLEDFPGRLAIVGPGTSHTQIREGLAGALRRLAKRGAAIVWILPPRGAGEEIRPSFYELPLGRGAIVVVQPELLADFATNPRSQLNLIYFCKLALNPAPLVPPDLALEP